MPPAPWMIAKAVSGNPIKEVSAAILKSQDRANSSPPPSACPFKHAIVGNYN